ncbi:MAG: YjgP/YjgQ family permease [Ignavibacteria bacterium]|nr:MAG: YjgP/YjgQ family permease [Ignavibacteria bacterium]
MMRLSFHILRAHAGPFLFSFVTLMFVFLLQFLMKFADQLVGKGLNSLVIGELITLSLAWMVVLAVPMSVLVSALMAFGSLSAQNEVTAMKAGGMSLYRMIAPVFIASMILTLLLIQFDNNVLPEANHRVKVLMVDIRKVKPTLAIVSGLFSQDIAGYSILARKTFEHSNDLEGITIYDYTDPGTNVVVTAERGTVTFTPDQRKLIMDLYNGEIHQLGTATLHEYRKMRYARHRIVMNAEGFDFERSNENAFGRGDRELSAQDMQHLVDSLEQANAAALEQVVRNEAYPFAGFGPSGSAGRDGGWAFRELPAPRPGGPPAVNPPVHEQAVQLALNRAHSMANAVDNQMMLIKYNRDQINQYTVEIHKKYAIPVACIVFVFIGAPLGIMARRGTFAVAASMSFGFFLLYWASLIGGEKLADRAIIPAWVGMWGANIIIGCLGIYLTLRMGRENLFINWLWFRKFLPRSLRNPGPPDEAQTGR